MSVSAVVSVTWKVAWPLEFVVPETVVIVEFPPFCWARVTVLFGTGLLFESSRVTVTVEVEEPFAVTEPGLEETVEVEAEAAPGVKVTVASLPEAMVRLLIVPETVAGVAVEVGEVRVAV